MHIKDRLHLLVARLRGDHPDGDILVIELDGWELILRRCEPRTQLVSLIFGESIFLLALDTPPGGVPGLLPVGNIANYSAVDSTGAPVTINPGTTGAATTIISASGTSVSVPAGQSALELLSISDGATSVVVTADIMDSTGVVDPGVKLTIPLPAAPQGTELVAFNAP